MREKFCIYCGKELTFKKFDYKRKYCGQLCSSRDFRKKNPDYKKQEYQRNKENWAKQQKIYYEKNKEILNEKHRVYYQENSEDLKKYAKEWRIEHQGYMREYLLNNPSIYKKAKICWIAKHYIKIPKNQLCEICNFELAIHRHHENYDKPLEIIFCCKRCHVLLDRERRKREENLLKNSVGGLSR